MRFIKFISLFSCTAIVLASLLTGCVKNGGDTAASNHENSSKVTVASSQVISSQETDSKSDNSGMGSESTLPDDFWDDSYFTAPDTKPEDIDPNKVSLDIYKKSQSDGKLAV